MVHETAIQYGGRTIAVLGNGFNNIFPPQNIDLYNHIIKYGGLALTEYELDEEAKTENFPKRNRIISGLSHGVLVVEAGYRSGASLTANIAITQGRKAFCIPCNIDSKYNRTNQLITKGMQAVINTKQIITDCGINVILDKNIQSNHINSSKKNTMESLKNINKTIPKEYKHIYRILSEKPKHIDYICKMAKEEIGKVSSILTMLELEGLIEQLPGKAFKIL